MPSRKVLRSTVYQAYGGELFDAAATDELDEIVAPAEETRECRQVHGIHFHFETRGRFSTGEGTRELHLVAERLVRLETG